MKLSNTKRLLFLTNSQEISNFVDGNQVSVMKVTKTQKSREKHSMEQLDILPLPTNENESSEIGTRN